jgi:hypothetical protein
MSCASRSCTRSSKHHPALAARASHLECRAGRFQRARRGHVVVERFFVRGSVRALQLRELVDQELRDDRHRVDPAQRCAVLSVDAGRRYTQPGGALVARRSANVAQVGPDDSGGQRRGRAARAVEVVHRREHGLHPLGDDLRAEEALELRAE